MIAGLRDLGKTIFLTTHYMDEAQSLADRVAIIAAGRIIAEGTPRRARRQPAAARPRSALTRPPARRKRRPASPAAVSANGREWFRQDPDREPAPALNALTGWALERGHELTGSRLRRPSLEDIYLELTEEAEG